MPVGTSVVIVDKDGKRVAELDNQGNLPMFLAVSGDYCGVTNKNGNYSAAQTGTVVWTPGSGKVIRLHAVELTTATAGWASVNMGATIVVPRTYMADNGGAIVGSFRDIWQAPSGDAALEFTSNIAGNHSVLMWGVEV